MRKVSLEDIAGPQRYGEMRDEFRRRIIELKRHRRVSVGDRVTLVFENFDTVLFQTQEMLHVERITDLDRVREEVEVYNELLPGENELSATLLIEITDQPRIADYLLAVGHTALPPLVGIRQPSSVPATSSTDVQTATGTPQRLSSSWQSS